MGEQGQGASARKKRKWARSDKIAIWALVVTAVVTVGLWAVDHLGKSNGPSGSITNVADNSVIRRDGVFVEGVAADIPLGSEVWIVVRAGVEGRWYPVKKVEVAPDGRWRSDEKADDPQDVLLTTPGQYYLQLYSADPAAVAALQKYKSESPKTGTYEGLDSLPGGAMILDQKTVTRNT